jgi:membrane-bound lytic murein transglycosylase D
LLLPHLLLPHLLLIVSSARSQPEGAQDAVCGLRVRALHSRRSLGVLLLILCSLWSWGQPLAADPFPRPAQLQSAIGFWMRIYSEFDVASGLIHDSRDLSVCYAPLYLNPGAPVAAQNRTIDEALARYRTALNALADGKRADLNLIEQRALHPWRQRGALPEELRAAAERVRFQRGQEDRFRSGLERARPWQARVERILIDQGLPVGLAALPHVESSYNPKAISKVGAAGLWQFMPNTARRYIRVDDEIDERFDVIKSSHAAANLLHHNHSVLEHWQLAITAYNHGLSGVRRAVRTTGSHDIVRIIAEYRGDRFGFASRNFYVAFVAAHDLAREPDRYFRQLDPDAALELTAPAYLPAPQLAEHLGISVHDLRAVNPRMHHDIWNGKQLIARRDRLRLPPPIEKRVAERRLAEFAARYGFDGQLPMGHYDLSYGESLSGVAARLGTSVKELVALNQLEDAHALKTGLRLQVPVSDVPVPLGLQAARLLPDLLSLRISEQEEILALASEVVERALSPTPSPVELTVREEQAFVEEAEIALAEETESASLASLAEAQPELAADPADYSVAADGSIEIQVAETLGHYAQWLGVDAARLAADNELTDDKPLMIGRRLRLDFSRAAPAEFERQRIAFHRMRQLDYFAQYRITGVAEHLIREGQSLWDIAVKTYQIPLWLLRQYNPDLDTNSVLPLDRPLHVPLVEARLQPGAPLTAAET